MDGSTSLTLRLALAQVNPSVGDIASNTRLVADAIEAAREAGADLVVLPELVITGYPPEDLLLKRHFLTAVEDALEELTASTAGIVALVGAPIREGSALFNAAILLADGERRGLYRKALLPNYGVFDERRYFESGPASGATFQLNGAVIGMTICEDIWFPGPPTSTEALAGASLVVNCSASPYHRGKGIAREAMIAERARENEVALALCNLVGGQDELVFDGHSVVVDANGQTLARAAQFKEQLLVCELELRGDSRPSELLADPLVPLATLATAAASSEIPSPALAEPLGSVAEAYEALVLALGDYTRKNGFEQAVLGLSGGIDSALVAVLAADALGAEHLAAVVMPSPHSSDQTQGDARRMIEALGCRQFEIGIEPMMKAYEEALAEEFSGTEAGIAEENLQARIRGNLVMALSNKFGWLALTTGNKSEMSVGYATLYGDMAGGFAVLKDVPKTLVFELATHANERAGREVIPISIIERAPSAELRPDQKDTDSLPPYEILDRALEEYVELDGGRESMIAKGIEPEIADRVIGLVDRAEYKRRQAPPGVKITPKAFGRDRRQPITNRFGG